MQDTMPNTSGPSAYGLLHLLTQARSDGRVDHYFVCCDCLDLVERAAGSIDEHDCPAIRNRLTLPAELLASRAPSVDRKEVQTCC